MSIFWIGGPEGIIVPFDKMNVSEEDRYFLPGVIHGGEDYLIQVYAWNNDGKPEDERIGAKYLFAQDIVEWSKEATMEDGTFNRDVFEEYINEGAEEFVICNDGTGDFVTLNEEWDKAKAWDYKDVISWAEKQIEKAKMEANIFELKVDVSNLRHELEGALLNGEDDLAPNIEKRLILRECQLFGALHGIIIDEAKLEQFVSSADFEIQCEKGVALDVLLKENGLLPPTFSLDNSLVPESCDASALNSNPLFAQALKHLAGYFDIDLENSADSFDATQRFEETLGFSFFEAVNASSKNYMLSDICQTYVSNFDVAHSDEENWKHAVRITVQGYQYQDGLDKPVVNSPLEERSSLDDKIKSAETRSQAFADVAEKAPESTR